MKQMFQILIGILMVLLAVDCFMMVQSNWQQNEAFVRCGYSRFVFSDDGYMALCEEHEASEWPLVQHSYESGLGMRALVRDNLMEMVNG